MVEFNYQTNEIINRYNNEDIVFIEVGYQEILCLHLYDEKSRIRKIITTFSDGTTRTDIFDSKDDVYFAPLGTIKVEIRKSKFTIKL